MIENADCDPKMKINKMTKLLAMPRSRSAPLFSVESRILFLRHQRVILDTDLAELYGVPVGRLNEQVKRNQDRFPPDFMFRLTNEESRILRSQIAISRRQHGGRRYLPHAFTEHGAIMAANVLNSKRAVQMGVYVVRAFVRLREMLAANGQLAAKINELEGRLDTHDSEIQKLLGAIRQLMTPEATPRRRIGFQLPGLRRKRDLIGG